MEYRAKMSEAMALAPRVIEETAHEFMKLSGRRYGLVGTYMAEGAEVLLITLGSMTGTAAVAVRKLRKQGKRVGLVNLRTVRPFPEDKIRQVCSGANAVAVVERNVSIGSGRGSGAMFPEVVSALYACPKRPQVNAVVAGLGGRDILPQDFVRVADHLLEGHESPESPPTLWIGLHHGS